MEDDILFPKSVIGVIGDSPNGIMLVTTAKRMGFKVVAYGSDEASPTIRRADVRVIGKLTDKEKLKDFAQRCSIVTYESEYVPSNVIKFLSGFTRVPQESESLEIFQDRLLERAFFEQLNINIAPYATIVSLDDIYQAISSIGYPCELKPIQKSIGLKEPFVINKQSDIARAANFISVGTYVLESIIPYSRYITVIAARNEDEELTFFPLVENFEKNRVLRETLTPVNIEKNLSDELKELTTNILNWLNYIGILQVSFYITEAGTIYIKNFIPSLTQQGYVFDRATQVSSFEQHLRVLAKMPLIQPKLVQPTGMVLLKKEDMTKLSSQWVLRNNWTYNLFNYPDSLRDRKDLGYILAFGESSNEIFEQIKTTGI